MQEISEYLKRFSLGFFASKILPSRKREHPLGAVKILNGQNYRGTNVSDSI